MTKIACPKCNWEPDGGAHWMCSCGHQWNTFETSGRCPRCGKNWEYTQCIPHRGGCPDWSLHIDWYRDLDDWLQEEVENLKQENVKFKM